MAPSQILVPLDGSPLAEDALVHALETFDCPVTVLNVVTPLDSVMSEGGVLGMGDEGRREAARNHTTNIVETARSRAEGDSQPVETVIQVGDSAETIIQYVEESAVEQVVMGGHGSDRNELARRMLGTVATAVVGESSVTVTVVR
jgi:nucleotide-binding universal stress UspA family protein